MANTHALQQVEKYTKVIRECENAIAFLERPDDARWPLGIEMSGQALDGYQAVKIAATQWLQESWEVTGKRAMIQQFRYRMKEAESQIKTYAVKL